MPKKRSCPRNETQKKKKPKRRGRLSLSLSDHNSDPRKARCPPRRSHLARPDGTRTFASLRDCVLVLLCSTERENRTSQAEPKGSPAIDRMQYFERVLRVPSWFNSPGNPGRMRAQVGRNWPMTLGAPFCYAPPMCIHFPFLSSSSVQDFLFPSFRSADVPFSQLRVTLQLTSGCPEHLHS